MVKKINTKEFNELNDEFIVLDVFAEWCGPCKMMAPFFEEISELDEFKNVKFCKVNVDEEEEIAELFNVSAIPTFIILKNKQEIARKLGFIPKVGLISWVKENTKQLMNLSNNLGLFFQKNESFLCFYFTKNHHFAIIILGVY